MKNNILLIALAVTVFAIQSCKKEDDSPVAKSYITNAPPASGYHYAVHVPMSSTSNQSIASWTTDGKTFNKFTNQFLLSSAVNICNDKIVIHSVLSQNKFEIAYADLSNLKSFKKVNSERMASEVAVMNDVVMTTSTEGSNNYFGYCDTKAGETKMTYVLLPAGNVLSDLKVLGNKMIAVGASTLGYTLAYSLNGKDLVFTAPPLLSNGTYEYFDGKLWMFSGTEWASTSDDDLGTATWEMGSIDVLNSNTTDTNGIFYYTGNIIPFGSEWRIYGGIYSSATGIIYPCVNISLNSGSTWTTHFLTGMPSYTNNTSWFALINATASSTIINHTFDGTFEEGIFSSENGIDFTKWTNQSEIDAYRNTFLNVKSVR